MPVLEPKTSAPPEPKFIDQEWLRQQLAELDAKTGFVPVPGVTAQQVRERIAEDLRKQGINPDDIVYPQDED